MVRRFIKDNRNISILNDNRKIDLSYHTGLIVGSKEFDLFILNNELCIKYSVKQIGIKINEINWKDAFPDQKITELDLSNNKIKKIDLSKLPETLVKLYMVNCNIEEICGEIPKTLKLMDISYNKIKTIKNIKFNEVISTLDINNNEIENIENEFDNISTKLSKLIFHNNPIASLKGIKKKTMKLYIESVLEDEEYNQSIKNIIDNIYEYIDENIAE